LILELIDWLPNTRVMNLPNLSQLRSVLTVSLVTAILCASGAAFADDAKKAKTKPARKPNPAMAKITDVEGLPRVLLIGDSISIGYTVAVREELKGVANVHRPLANCGPTTRGVAAIDEWLETGGADKKWDVIHFNWGLHDLKYMGPKGQNLADPKGTDSVQQVPPAEYEKNLRTLVERLKKTGATLIWRNTTPVPEGAAGRLVGDSVKYNEIAAKVMKEHDIATDDLYSIAKEKMAEIMLPANVHFKPEGSKLLGAKVANTIKAALEKR
jgi:acyl-CoA thioesterase-1